MRGRISWLALALLLPAGLGIWVSLRLAGAAWSASLVWPVRADGADAIVARLQSRESGEIRGELDRALLESSGLAGLDYRYPLRLGKHFWFAGDGASRGGAQLFQAYEHFLEAVRRAPSHAAARFYLAGAARQNHRAVLADEQARAALSLAPVRLDLRRRVSKFFQARYLETGAPDHLGSAVGALDSERAQVIRAIRTDPKLTYGQVLVALGRAGVEADWAVRFLGETGRWEWALRFAEEEDAHRRHGGRLLGLGRLLWGEELLSRGEAPAALVELEGARALLGNGFEHWLSLARARLLCGDVDGGLVALGAALEGSEGAVPRNFFSKIEVPSERVIGFWRERRDSGDDRPEVSLALARALLSGGEPLEAQEILRALRSRSEVAAEANYLLARSLFTAGSASMALSYAEKAVDREPDNEEYRSLLEEIKR